MESRPKKKHDITSSAAPDQDQVNRSRQVKDVPIVDPSKRALNASILLPSILANPFLQSMGEMNNFVPDGDYAFSSQVSPLGRFNLIKKIGTCVMRMILLLN